eukprot:sb/3474211/
MLLDRVKQPIRTRYLVQVTGYQPIRDQYFLIGSVPENRFQRGFIANTDPHLFSLTERRIYKSVSHHVGLVAQGEGPPVHGYSEDQLVLGNTTSGVVLHSPVLKLRGDPSSNGNGNLHSLAPQGCHSLEELCGKRCFYEGV